MRNILAQKGFQVIKVVTGRSQFDDVIDWFRARVLKRGIVSKIVHQADRQRDEGKRRALMRRAILLNKFASLAYSVLKIPAVFFLFLIRATGKSMYVNARKQAGRAG